MDQYRPALTAATALLLLALCAAPARSEEKSVPKADPSPALLAEPGTPQGEYRPVLDLWPVVRYWRSPELPGRHLEALGPIVEWHFTPETRAFYLRPVYNRRVDVGSKVIESELLWPIGFGTTRPDLKRRVGFPLYLREQETFSDGTDAGRTIFLPFYYRRDKREEPSPDDFLIFPFYGRLHNFFGREKVIIVLWPAYTWQKSAEARKWSVLTPFFSHTRWNDGGRGYKAWPLFGINRRPDMMTALFVLWPIFHYQHLKSPVGVFHRWWVFPLIGKIDDPKGYEWSVLWPFFSHRVDRNVEESQWWYPWPLFGHMTGKESHGWWARPFFSREVHPGVTSGQFLWPLGYYRFTERPDEKTASVRLIPLAFREKEQFRGAETGAWQLWPLVKWRNEANGSQLEVPSLFPVRHYAPWERNFAPLFRVFEYRRSKEEVRSWRLLWRVVRVDTGPSVRYVEVTPFFDAHVNRSAEPGVQWRVLKGLFGYRRSPEGRRVQLLYFLKLGGHRD